MGQLLSNLLAIEIEMRPVLVVILSHVFCERASGQNRWVICTKMFVNHQSSVKYQTRIVHCLKSIIVDRFVVKAEERFTLKLQWFCLGSKCRNFQYRVILAVIPASQSITSSFRNL